MDQSSGRDEAPPASEGYVFLSYARADEKSARAIIKLIERTGFRVWWDGLIPSSSVKYRWSFIRMPTRYTTSR